MLMFVAYSTFVAGIVLLFVIDLIFRDRENIATALTAYVSDGPNVQ